MRDYVPEVNMVRFTEDLIIHKVQVVVDFILAFKWLLNSFPKELIVSYFACVKFSPISHIPKLCQALRKPIREQKCSSIDKGAGAPFLLLQELPLHCPWACQTFLLTCLSSLTWNSWMVLSSSWTINKSTQVRFSKSLLVSIFICFRVVNLLG